jgi:lysophospholipase L1-like esterase
VASVAILVMAAALVGAEAFARRRDSRAPQLDLSPIYYRHDHLQRAFVRGADYRGRVHINAHGFRGPEIEARKPADVRRIVVMGASVAFDPCVSTDSAAWPARLDHWLRELAPGSKFEVINAGVPGYGMLQSMIRLEDEIYPFKPDVVLLYAGHGIVSARDIARAGSAGNGDVPSPSDSPTPHEVSHTMPWDTWLGRHSLLYHKVMARLRRRGQANTDARAFTKAEWESGIEQGTADFRHELISFALIAKAQGAHVVLAEMARVSGVLQGSELGDSEREIWQRAYPIPPEITLESIRQSGAVQRAVSDSLGLTFVASNEFGIVGPQNYCVGDAIHFNDTGSDLMGRRLAESLLSRGVLKPAEP